MPIRDLGGSGFGGSGSAGFKLGAPQNVFDAGVGAKASAVLLRDSYATSNPSWLVQYQTDFDDKSPSSVLLLYTEAGVPVATYTQYNGSTQGWRDLSTAKGLRGLKGDEGVSVISGTISGDDVVFTLSNNSTITITDLAKSQSFESLTGSVYDNESLTEALSSKQSTLVSGVNLKTINNVSLLGTGNIDIEGGGGGVTDHNLLTNRDTADQHPITAISGLTESLSQKVDKEVGKGLSDENYTSLEKLKLSGVAEEATKNQPDAFLLNRNNHTGSIPIASVDNLQSTLDDKVTSSDSRLTDAREWIAGEVSLEEAQARTSGTFKKWSALRVGQAVIAWWQETGNQAIIDDLISSEDLADALAGKVDKVAGFGLSQANFTQAEKDKLAALEDSKFKGLYEDLAALQAAYPTAEAGSYAFIDGTAGNPNQLYVWATDQWEIVGGEVVSLTPAQVKQLLLENADTNNFSDSDKQKLQDAVTQTELASVLTGYAQAVHNHTIAQVTGLQSELDNKAASDHGHVIGDITGLQTALDNKANSIHSHNIDQITGLQTALDDKANEVHGHQVSDVSGLSATLNNKVDKEAGKGLSTHDYDATAKSKVDGLGTAASRDVMTSPIDRTTPNALMPRGAFSLGSSTPIDLPVFDLNDLDIMGPWNVGVGTPNWPYAGTGGVVVQYAHGGDAYITQIAYAPTSHTMKSRTKVDSTNWTAWVEIYNSGNVVRAVSQVEGFLTGGLMDWGETPNGFYARWANGFQKCWRLLTYTPPETESWQFPALFSPSAAVVVLPSSRHGVDKHVSIALTTPTTTSVDYSAKIIFPDGIPLENIGICLEATGRWY